MKRPMHIYIFNMSCTYKENIKIPPSFLSRFVLEFSDSLSQFDKFNFGSLEDKSSISIEGGEKLLPEHIFHKLGGGK